MASVGARTLARVRREALRNGFQRETGLLVQSYAGGTTHAKLRTKREVEPVGIILDSFYQANKRFAKKLLLPQIVEIWDMIVGPAVAQHTVPKHLTDDVLYVTADSTVWAAQLSTLSPLLVNKINVITGSGEIAKIQVSGPKANVPNYGPRTPKGRIGYRDTFG